MQDAARVTQAIAAGLRLHETYGEPLLTLVTGMLAAARRALLVLDNCEHVIAACAEAAYHLLTKCPGPRILATSREPLCIPGEVVSAGLDQSAIFDLQSSTVEGQYPPQQPASFSLGAPWSQRPPSIRTAPAEAG